MHFVVSVAVVGVLYLGLFHTRVNRWVVIVGAIVASNVAHVVVGTTMGTMALLAEYAALFAVVAVGLAKRNLDSVVDDLDDMTADPTMIRADGVAVVEHLEAKGFERAPEGWLHFERHAWDAIALHRGPVNAFLVSGDQGPLVELTSLLDDDHIVMSVTRARDRVLPHILRQCLPGADVDTLAREHDRALDWTRRMGRTGVEIPGERLTERMLTEERAAAAAVRRSVAGSLVRELRRQHLDLGSIVDRPDAIRRLRRRP